MAWLALCSVAGVLKDSELMKQGNSFWRWVKWSLLALMAGTAVTTLILLLSAGDDKLLQVVDTPESAQGQQAYVDRPLIVEQKAGKIVWRLKAQKAEQELTGSLYLVKPELELYSEEGKTVPIAGQEAWFNPLTKSVKFKGDVVVHYNEWTLYADEVRYEHASDTVQVPGVFRIEGKLTKVQGRGMTAWRGDRHVYVEDAVRIEDRHSYKMQAKP